MIYLSIQSAISLKENSEVNGSVFEPEISSELKTLLERYAKMLGFTLSDAIDRVLGILDGQKSFEVFGSDLIDWSNFAIILNSWDLSARKLDRVNGERDTWQIVNSLVEKTIAEYMSSTELSITTPWINLPILVQLVSEPLAWHGLVLQACVRSSLPSGKRKKKSGQTDPSALSRMRDSVHSLCDTLEKLINWLKEHLNKPVDKKLDSFLSTFHTKEQDGPGQVFEVLEMLASSANEADHGDRIFQSLKSWSSVDVARKVVIGKSALLVEFLCICESKFKMLQGLKRRIV